MATGRNQTERVVLVAGATRGVGRGVACAFAERGATVYCTGRSTAGAPSDYGRPETIEQTAALVDELGGRGIAVVVDHADDGQVRGLIERIRRERGRLDVLVNGVAGEDPRYAPWGTAFWELDLGQAHDVLRTTLLSHLVAARHAAPLMKESGGRLIASISEFDLLAGGGNTALAEIAKSGVKTLMFRLAEELLDARIATVTAVPGFLRTERMLEHFGVTEDNWRDAGEKDPHFLQSETPRYLGRGLAALAEDESRMELTGDVLSSWELARRYDVTDIDGSRPNWGPYFAGIMPTLGWIHDGLRRQVAWLDGMAQRGRDYLSQVT